jgi:hypothetical protein
LLTSSDFGKPEPKRCETRSRISKPAFSIAYAVQCDVRGSAHERTWLQDAEALRHDRAKPLDPRIATALVAVPLATHERDAGGRVRDDRIDRVVGQRAKDLLRLPEVNGPVVVRHLRGRADLVLVLLRLVGRLAVARRQVRIVEAVRACALASAEQTVSAFGERGGEAERR